MKRKLRMGNVFILILSVILICFLSFIEKDKKLVKDLWYNEKYESAILMDRCIKEIKNEKIARDMKIDFKYDINNTGIIGEEINGITTTLGSLESKRTSANPNFAAVMIDLFKGAGLKSNNYVAINFSSSFPALNIAILSACEVLELNPIIITSIGSSTWGGNNIDFTYLDMEEFLYDKGLISNKSIAISIGGGQDVGKDIDEEDVNKIIHRMMANNKQIIIEENLESNIKLRYDLYYNNIDKINCFINVGGNIVSFGNTMDSTYTSPGLLKGKSYDVTNKTGLVQLFSSKNIPVIHILNVKELAHTYGLEIDPGSDFIVGVGDVYYSYAYPYKLIVFFVIMTVVSLIIYKKKMRIPYD